jgi:hypothetical protein
MYYKVMKGNKVIDVLDRLVFVKYQEKNNLMVVCARNGAQAIMSSDCNSIWHANGLQPIPIAGYDTVEVVMIDKYEYDQLKLFNLRSISEIIDEYTLQLIEGGLL